MKSYVSFSANLGPICVAELFGNVHSRNGVRHHFSNPPLRNCGSQLRLSMALISLIALAAPTEKEITAMASITIRNLDDEIMQRRRVRATERGH